MNSLDQVSEELSLSDGGIQLAKKTEGHMGGKPGGHDVTEAKGRVVEEGESGYQCQMLPKGPSK